MSRDIISINSTHYVGNNLYRLKLPKAVEFKKGDKLSLYSFSMYNSFYNISQTQYQNTNITFTWFDNTIYNWTIPDGYYSLSDGYYYIIFVQFQTNSVLYKAQIDVYFMPSSANALLYGYQVVPGASWTFPSQNTMVRITINDNLKTYFGTSQTTFGIITPAQNMNYLSDVCPSISRVFSIYLGCNLITSDYNQIGNLFSQFPISASYGN
jgi:hypothetical protein